MLKIKEERSEEKMSKIVAVHSSRGGVGKTLIAVNLAAAYAKRGRSVFLVDLDFRAPSLLTIFGAERPDFWVNDFLNKRCGLEDMMTDVASKYGIQGKFLVGFADPSLDSIRDMASKDRRWEMEALRSLLAMRKLQVDYVIFDTSPGVLYSSVNAVACSDSIIVVTTPDALGISSTRKMVEELYRAFGKKTSIFINKIMPENQWEEPISDKLSTLELPAPVLATAPCYCDMLSASRREIYSIEKPEHAFSKKIYEIVEKM